MNRRVDAQLGYQTRTLVAVPLRAAGGELLGVFEVINKRAGEFGADDEVALIELASHAVVALGPVCVRAPVGYGSRRLLG